MREICTTITIAAPAAAVWQVLTDFAAYPGWNPFLRAVSGEARAGTRLRIVVQPAGRKPSTFTPEVLVSEPGRELRWRGSLPIPGLFVGEHRFVLTERDGQTELEHAEDFFGLLPPLMSGLIKDTAEGFRLMNAALKARVESLR